MTSLKLFFTNIQALAGRLQADGQAPIDAIDHPDIRRMDLRQIADLPFPGRAAEQAAQHREARRDVRRAC